MCRNKLILINWNVCLKQYYVSFDKQNTPFGCCFVETLMHMLH